MLKIVKAAIRYRNKVTYTGKEHCKIIEKIFKKTGEDANTTSGYVFGFVDQNGKFYTRYSAGVIAHQAGQIDKQPMELFSYMIKMEG